MHLHLILFILIQQNTYSSAAHFDDLITKGGLIFEKVQEAPLNQDYVAFSRKLEMSTLEPLKGMLKGALITYDQICEKAQQKVGPMQDHSVAFTPQQENGNTLPSIELTSTHIFMATKRGLLRNSESTCKRLGARLPEIRQIQDISKLKAYCVQANTNDVISNIKFDYTFNRYYFSTDKAGMEEGAYSTMAIRNNNGTESQLAWTEPIPESMLKIATGKPVIYHNCQTNPKPISKDLPTEYGPIHCEVKKAAANTHNAYDTFQSALFEWTSHNCERDQAMVSQQVHQAINEMEEITDTKKLTDESTLLKYSDFIPVIVSEDPPKPSQFQVQIIQLSLIHI